MTDDQILDVAEDVIWEAFTAGASFTDALAVIAKGRELTEEEEERVAHSIQCANIKVWWDADFQP